MATPVYPDENTVQNDHLREIQKTYEEKAQMPLASPPDWGTFKWGHRTMYRYATQVMGWDQSCRQTLKELREVLGLPPLEEPIPEPGPIPVVLEDQLFGLWWWATFTSLTAKPYREEFFNIARDCGCNATEGCLDDAWFNAPEYGYTGFVPWERANGTPAAGGSGPFNLERPSEAFWDHFLSGVELANSKGLVVQVKVQPVYYSWHEGKQGYPYVPNYNFHPRRYNIQGEVLGDPNPDDGGHFFIASSQDVYGNQLIVEASRRLKPYVDAKRVYFCTALEMAESRLHEDTKTRITQQNPNSVVICNRQEWTPGVWRNMVYNKRLHGNEEHGKKYLQPFLSEYVSNNKPPSREEMLRESKAYNPRTVFLSSDGCRISEDPNNTYDYAGLEEVAVYMLREHGGNWSQQSCAKMPPFVWGRVDFGPMLAREVPMMKNIYRRWRG